MADELTITPKQRARLAKVREILASGGNPYSKDNTDEVQVHVAKPVTLKRELSQDEVARLEAKWKSGEGRYITIPVSLEDVDMGGPIVPVPAGMVKCSFCSVIVPSITTTSGKGKLRKIIKETIYRDSSGKLHWDQETKHTTDRIIACKGCVGNIKDTKFPPMEG